MNDFSFGRQRKFSLGWFETESDHFTPQFKKWMLVSERCQQNPNSAVWPSKPSTSWLLTTLEAALQFPIFRHFPIPFRSESFLFSRYTPMLFHFMLLLITFSLPENSFPPSCDWMLRTKALITLLFLVTGRVSDKEIVQDVHKDLA